MWLKQQKYAKNDNFLQIHEYFCQNMACGVRVLTQINSHTDVWGVWPFFDINALIDKIIASKKRSDRFESL